MWLRSVLAALGAGVVLSIVPVRAAEVARPPQCVMLAFDNCGERARWQDLRDFAAEMDRAGKRVRFTFFVSGINCIEDADRAVYQGPGQRRGYSSINFGGSAQDVKKRIAYVNALYAE